MSNYRETHKSALKAIIQALIFEGDNILVNSYYTTTASRYPYVFVTDGSLIPNTSGGSQYEMGAGGYYRRGYEYQINAVFRVGEADGETEVRMAALEALMIDALQSRAVRDSQAWLDLVVKSVTGAYGTDVSLTEGCVMETFTIQIDELVGYA